MSANDIFKNILQSINLPINEINNVSIKGQDPILPTPFLVGETGAATLAAIGYLASEIWHLKTKERQNIAISVRDAAIAQKSHQYIKTLDGVTQNLWDPISGLYQTKDKRWIQFHCNFPHHKAGVLELLKCQDNKEAVTNATQNFNADYLEEALSNAGMCAAMVRTDKEWQNHPQFQATKNLPIIEITKIGDSEPEKMPIGDRPLSNIKVLDLTRVIAGPVCGRTLAEHGADVLLVTSPKLPYIMPLVIDTGHGKLSLYLDLTDKSERDKLLKLAKKSDIFCQSYRPGGLDALGFSPNELAKIRPGIIYVNFSAYSNLGPWANKHGFDSLLQSVTGIALEQGTAEKPEHLPAQSLDYLTGYFGALGAMEALRRRAIDGGSYLVNVSLVKTAGWFKELGRCSDDFKHRLIPTRENIADILVRQDTKFGKIEYLKPILRMSKTPVYWDLPTIPLGTTKIEDIIW